jgi:hypothetical protein
MGISHLALGCREWAAMSWLPALSPELQILLRLGIAELVHLLVGLNACLMVLAAGPDSVRAAR